MNELKKFVISEIETAIQKEMTKSNINELNKILVEAVSTASLLKNRNSKKHKVANKLVSVLENKLSKEYKKYNESFEGEGVMLKAQLLSIMENAERLYHMIDEEDQFEDWMQSKVTVAEDYLRAVTGYLKYYNRGNDMENEDDFDELEYDDEDFDEEDFDEFDYEDEDFDEEDFDDDLDYEDDDDFDDDLDDDFNEGK